MIGKIEITLGSLMLFIMFVLVFVSAITRTFGHPLNWAQDTCLVIFAWLAFIGGDYLMRSRQMVNVDLLRRKLPPAAQKVLSVVFDILIILFLCFLIKYGFQLIGKTKQRIITTIGISYTWVTSSVPFGSILMITTAVTDLIMDIRKPLSEYKEKK